MVVITTKGSPLLPELIHLCGVWFRFPALKFFNCYEAIGGDWVLVDPVIKLFEKLFRVVPSLSREVVFDPVNLQ